MTIFILLETGICMERLKAWEMGLANSGALGLAWCGLGFRLGWETFLSSLQDLYFAFYLRIGFYPIF